MGWEGGWITGRSPVSSNSSTSLLILFPSHASLLRSPWGGIRSSDVGIEKGGCRLASLMARVWLRLRGKGSGIFLKEGCARAVGHRESRVSGGPDSVCIALGLAYGC